jgi:RNA polymerase sigma-70 factor, ECF subfamily
VHQLVDHFWCLIMTDLSALRPDSSDAEFPSFSHSDIQQLMSLARRLLGCDHLAQDALQEAFLSLSQQPEQPAHPVGWLTRAVVFRSRNLRRSAGRRARHEHRVSEDCDLHTNCDNPLHVAIAHEVGELLTAVRDSLPREQRKALDLYEVDGRDYFEIATSLGVPIGTVRSRLARARQALRAAIRA